MTKIDFKKLDKMDIAICSEPWTPEERTAFSAFLKAEKLKRQHKEGPRQTRMKSPPIRSREHATK
jgi:hypothetical protein